MNRPLGNLDPADFLRDYWQKKPLLIRQAFPAFEPQLDSNDIAGLACDELAEARLISGSYPEHDWELEYGPFDEGRLQKLAESRWTLLVQDVEKHYPPLRALVDAFDFLPRWRVDDLMVSVAAPGGSVGPHSDQYDVFLLQAEGCRTWQIAENGPDELLPGTELNVLKTFQAEQEWTLEPGDMLYLPPGVAHHGVALDRCMTWSIGMRAPSTADLMQAWGEWLASNRDEGPRYSDPDLAIASDGAEIDAESIGRFTRLASGDGCGNADFTEFLGSFLSRYRLAHEPLGPEQAMNAADLAGALENGFTLRQNPWTRLLWTANDRGATLYAAGSTYACSRAFAVSVCEPDRLEHEAPALAAENPALLGELVNAGHLYLEAPP